MALQLTRTTRYVRSWLTGHADVVEEETTLDRDGTRIPATVLRPAVVDSPLPGWVVLHGITRTGRAHPQLVRFTRTVAATGMVVILPEVPEWRELSLEPQLALPTVQCSITALKDDPGVQDRPYGLMGFSFSAPHALAVAAAEEVRADIAGVVGFGGYYDLERTIAFMLTGRHEYAGKAYQLIPDPYGRWIVAANYLNNIPGHEEAIDVTQGLRRLAALAGDIGRPAQDPYYDAAKAEERAKIDPDRQFLFDFFAPLSGLQPSLAHAEEFGHKLAKAAIRVEPKIQPFKALEEIQCPVHVLHGRNDNLIPFTEGLRMKDALPAQSHSYATITRLFGHSTQNRFPSPFHAVQELIVFLRALERILGLV
ncbi:MAG: alpha/beta hydrolase [Gemmatimonadetes bacterium]|nr:alpha/beta hydrolase [Gemmatimonadota bacterium]